MKMLKNVLSHLHTFVLWLLLSAFFWSWIFTFVTDAAPEQKVVVYCKVPELRSTELSVALEERMPEGLRMIQVHSFDYVMFDLDAFYGGDIFIVPVSEIETYADVLVSLEGEQGLKAYDALTGTGLAMDYIHYGQEDYYLYLGSRSVHLEDGKAMEVARQLLTME